MLTIFRLRSVNQILSIFVLIAILNLVQGCYYYKVTPASIPPKYSLPKLHGEKKFIILHQGQFAWHFTDISISEDTIKGKISNLVGHNHYLTTKPEGATRYIKGGKRNESEVLNEVHVYASSVKKPASGQVAFHAKSVSKVEIYDPATGATSASWIFGGLAVAIPVILLIVALTKQSCPFIYVNDGLSDQFVGEIYSGAIYPSLERHDYLPLPAKKAELPEYTIKMTNEVHEIQHTNLVELNVYEHPAGTQVLVDKYGICRTTSDLQAPFEATNLKGKDILPVLRNKDTLSYIGDGLEKDQAIKDGIILKFKRPAHAGNAKLAVKAKSSFWLDYVFSRFHELFGREYDCWVTKQETVPDKKMKNWMLEQDIPLSVYIEKEGRWKFVDYYNIVGPMAAKEDIMVLDISDIQTDMIRIKLEYGFLFWEVDYAAIDYSKEVPVKQSTATFNSAIDNNGKDVKNLLIRSDSLYYIQPEIGDLVEMKFTIPKPAGAEQTLIMHSKGYYKIIMNQDGDQMKKQLLAFRKKGHFPEFSNQLYKRQASTVIR